MPASELNIIYAFLAGILPALLWLWFWLQEDSLHPEPKKLIAMAFIAGSIGVIFAAGFEKIAQDHIGDITLKYAAWAAIEEIIKFAAVFFVALRTKYLDEPIDAMIYCISVALGFSALENVLFILYPLSTEPFIVTVVVGNLRFIGASLVHVVSSATIGFMIGISFYKGRIFKIISVAGGIALAITLHAAFNLAIIGGTATNAMLVFGWVWCAAIILIILFEEVKAVKAKV